jgi:hypothetical protein
MRWYLRRPAGVQQGSESASLLPSQSLRRRQKTIPALEIAIVRPAIQGLNSATALLDWTAALTTTRNRTKRFRWLAEVSPGDYRLRLTAARFFLDAT